MPTTWNETTTERKKGRKCLIRARREKRAAEKWTDLKKKERAFSSSLALLEKRRINQEAFFGVLPSFRSSGLCERTSRDEKGDREKRNFAGNKKDKFFCSERERERTRRRKKKKLKKEK